MSDGGGGLERQAVHKHGRGRRHGVVDAQEVPRSDTGWLQGVSSRIELTRQLVASHRVLEALRGGEP